MDDLKLYVRGTVFGLSAGVFAKDAAIDHYTQLKAMCLKGCNVAAPHKQATPSNSSWSDLVRPSTSFDGQG